MAILELVKQLQMYCQDFQSNVRFFKFSGLSVADVHADKLRESIRSAIPQVIGLLVNDNPRTRQAAAGVLSGFSEKCKISNFPA